MNIFKTLTDDINFNIQLPICLHNWNPPPSPLIMGGLSFWKLAKIGGDEGAHVFSIKMEELAKYGGLF